MQFEHSPGIYICTCTANGKSYIGQSKDVKLRKCQHLSELRHGKHFNTYWQNAYNKYGEDSFKWRVLEYCDTQMLDERELYWIKQYNSFYDGFNSNEGGAANRRYVRTEEYKHFLSRKLKAVWNNNEARRKEQSNRMFGDKNPMYGKYGALNPAYGTDRSGKNGTMFGKHHTEAAKELNRIAHTGAKNKLSKPVVCNETQAIFDSQGEAARIMGCSYTTINKCCRGVKKTAGGYHWRYATPEEIINKTHIA